MGTEEDARKLFVAGLPDTVTDDGLRALFTGTGAGIDELSLPRDRATGRPRGFAFVTLSSSEDAQRAREQLDGSLLEGRSISVRPFTSGPPRTGAGGFGAGPGGGGGGYGGGSGGGGYGGSSGGGGGGYGGGSAGGGYGGGGGGGGGYGGGGGAGGGPAGAAGFERRPPPPRDDSNRTLYVGNLPYDIEETDLRNIFQQMNAVGLDRIHLPMDHATGRKRGFAFVSFQNEDAAKAGLEAVGDLNIRGRQCTVHIAHPRGERPPPREGGRPSFGGPPGGGPLGGGMRSGPPPGMGGGGGGSGGPPRGGFGPPAPPGGNRPRPRADGEGEARGAKGVTRKNRLEQEKRRGGGNARRYMDDVDDDE